MKTRKFKLIKEFPFSPPLNTVVTFETKEDYIEGIYNVAALPVLMLSDLTDYPEFWEDLSNEDIEKEVDNIFENSTYQLNCPNIDWVMELDISLCKKEIVEYIKRLLNEKISDL